MDTRVQHRKRRLAAFAVLGGLLHAGARAFSTERPYPKRPIALTVGYPPGGGADILARSLGEYLARELKQKVVVHNKPGAASNIAAEAVAHARPDGYTLYISTRANTIHKTMYGNFDFDVASDFAPVGVLAKVPNVIVTASGTFIATIADLIAFASAHPGRLTYASTGVGSDTHLLGELFQQQTGIELLHVPYRGGAAAMADVISGRVDMLIFSLPGSLPYIKAGAVRAIALMSDARLPAIEDTPTLAEAGVPGVNLETWFGLMAPAGTPQPVIAKLNEAVNTVLMNPGLRATLAGRGYVVPLSASRHVVGGEHRCVAESP
ncbi:Bug family tripartite tricarboxylate transporter substrate binding protein [Bordetella genomosp. 11]|nr:tripartite tricarboxylate transporter substrate binding protein [Bordetella genomosp. 11]